MKQKLIGLMGALLMAVPAFGEIILQPIGSDDVWNLVVSPFGTGSTFQLMTGSSSQVPIPYSMVYVNGFLQPTNMVSEFMIRVEPASVARGCRPGGENDNDDHQTTIAVPQGVFGSIDYVGPNEFSKSKFTGGNAWTNFRFAVNNGLGLQTLAIQPGFVTIPGPQQPCNFEVLYRYKPTHPVVYYAPKLAPASAPASAPAALGAAPTLRGIDLPEGHKAAPGPIELKTGKVEINTLTRSKK